MSDAGPSLLEIVGAVSAAVTALGIGGLIGARLQADRERQERMRERMLAAANDFVTATMSATSLVQRAAGVAPQQRGEILGEALTAYRESTGHVARLALLFPPEREGAAFAGAHVPATEVVNAVGEAIRRVAAGESLDQVSDAFGQIGTRQGTFARHVNDVAWSRKLRPRRPPLRR